VTGTCTHSGTTPPPAKSPAKAVGLVFAGTINGQVSSNVRIGGAFAAVQGSTADNTPPHVPQPPIDTFVPPPTNKATIDSGSSTVKINGKQAARAGDPATTCDENNTKGKVVATGTVSIGG